MAIATKILDYKGKAIIKIPRKFSKALGIKPGDTYTTSVTPEGNIIFQLLHRAAASRT